MAVNTDVELVSFSLTLSPNGESDQWEPQESRRSRISKKMLVLLGIPLILVACGPGPRPPVAELANAAPAPAGCPKKEVAPDCAPEFPFGNEGKKLYIPDIRYVWMGSIQYSKPSRTVSSPYFGFDWKTLEPLKPSREPYPLARGVPTAVSFNMRARWTTETFMPAWDPTLRLLEDMHPSDGTPLITPPAGFQYFEENRELPAQVDGYHKDFVFIKLPTKANPGEWLRCTWIFKDAKGPAHRGTCKASFVVDGGINVDAKFEFADQADVPFAEVRQATVALINRWRSPPPGVEPTPSRLPPSESTAGIPRWVKPPSTFQEKAQIDEFPFGKDGKKLYVPRHEKRISPVYNAAMNLSSLSARFDLDTLDPHKWPNAGEEAKNMLSLHLKARLGEGGAPFRDLAYYTLKYMHPSKNVPWVMPPEGFTYYEDGYYIPPGVNERVLAFYKPAVGNKSEVALRCKVTLKMADGMPNTTPAECWAEFVVPDGIHVKAFFPVEGGNSQAAFTKAYAGAHILIDRWRVVP